MKFNQEVLIEINLERLRIILFFSVTHYYKPISQTLEKNAKLTWDSRKQKEQTMMYCNFKYSTILRETNIDPCYWHLLL